MPFVTIFEVLEYNKKRDGYLSKAAEDLEEKLGMACGDRELSVWRCMPFRVGK